MFKKNQWVVQILSGGGVETATVQQVESVKKGVVKLRDSSTKFDNERGCEIDPVLMGFSKRLVVFDGGEVEKLKLK